ncbi:MAG: Gfo/Idh/MocA family oxidoreductase [Planctomycetota bacterium]|jgi:predicted dehydrogenase
MKEGIDRRQFIRSTAAAGAALYLSPGTLAQGPKAKPDDINVALLGAGAQGQVLMMACMKIPGVRFKAVCDIWDYNRNWVSKRLKAYRHQHNSYADYQEMLDKETDIDAVIIATPDFWHAEHAIAALEAGRNVYCEKEMSNTVENAKKIVEAVKKSDKLLQIGHQRRSNPRYAYCYEKLIKEAKLLNRITTVSGQWNRSRAACEDQGWPRDSDMDEATLNKYGFESMKQFRNWRWYKGLGGGPIVDLGSHQIDIYNWFLEARPKSVMASGGIDYWQGHQWYDNVMVIYEYETKLGAVRAFYQTLTTNSSNGYFESFLGDEGTLVISEQAGRGSIYRESWVDEAKWDQWIKKGYLKKHGGKAVAADSGGVADVRSTVPAAKYDLPVKLNKPFHQPHLENFFDAVRGKAKLNCPVEIGYETAVTVLKVNEAVQAGRRLDFKPEEFGLDFKPEEFGA